MNKTLHVPSELQEIEPPATSRLPIYIPPRNSGSFPPPRSTMRSVALTWFEFRYNVSHGDSSEGGGDRGQLGRLGNRVLLWKICLLASVTDAG